MAEFARQHGLVAQRVQWWTRKLAHEAARADDGGQARETAVAQFVPVVVRKDDAWRTTAVVVRLGRHWTPSTLKPSKTGTAARLFSAEWLTYALWRDKNAAVSARWRDRVAYTLIAAEPVAVVRSVAVRHLAPLVWVEVDHRSAGTAHSRHGIADG